MEYLCQKPTTADVLREQFESLIEHAEHEHSPCRSCIRLEEVARALMKPFEKPLSFSARAGR